MKPKDDPSIVVRPVLEIYVDWEWVGDLSEPEWNMKSARSWALQQPWAKDARNITIVPYLR